MIIEKINDKRSQRQLKIPYRAFLMRLKYCTKIKYKEFSVLKLKIKNTFTLKALNSHKTWIIYILNVYIYLIINNISIKKIKTEKYRFTSKN